MVTIFYVGYLLKQCMDFLQTYIDILLEQTLVLIKFGDLDLIFKVTGGLKFIKIGLNMFSKKSFEPVA